MSLIKDRSRSLANYMPLELNKGNNCENLYNLFMGDVKIAFYTEECVSSHVCESHVTLAILIKRVSFIALTVCFKCEIFRSLLFDCYKRKGYKNESKLMSRLDFTQVKMF